MTEEMAKHEDHEQEREKINTMRILGGLFLIVGLLLYFFHMAEAPERAALGVLSGIFAFCGTALLFVGWLRIRALR